MFVLALGNFSNYYYLFLEVSLQSQIAFMLPIENNCCLDDASSFQFIQISNYPTLFQIELWKNDKLLRIFYCCRKMRLYMVHLILSCKWFVIRIMSKSRVRNREEKYRKFRSKTDSGGIGTKPISRRNSESEGKKSSFFGSEIGERKFFDSEPFKS